MQILILTPFYNPNVGGAESFVDGLVKEASKCHNVTVLTFQPFTGRAKEYEKSFYEKGSLEVRRLSWCIRQGKAWQGTSLKNFFTVIPQMAFYSFLLTLRKKMNIIHAQGLISGLIAVILKKIFNIKVFITLLALYDFDKQKKIFNQISKFILKNCDIIFVEGENGKQEIEKLIGRNIRIRIFNHWVDQETFKPPQGRESEKIRILFIARPIPEKGKHIIEGAERLLNNPKYEFKYVTEVKFSELPAIYASADIFCCPSLYSEGHTRVVAEAASCGCAVITSNKGSLPEQVKGWGISVEPTMIQFAYEIANMDSKEYGRRSYEYAKENFGSKNAEVFLNEYDKQNKY